MTTVSFTLQKHHELQLKEWLLPQTGEERAAYILCGESYIQEDPWDRRAHRKFISYEVISVPEDEIVSASATHITWQTRSFVRALKRAQEMNLSVAIIHSHPQGEAVFSEQDDNNEPDLIEAAQNRNGPGTPLLSLVMGKDNKLAGRLWQTKRSFLPVRLIRVIGESIYLHYENRGRGVPDPVLHRQGLAFGEILNQDLSVLRVGIVGCGGTGSATAMLLARHGVKHIAVFDNDIVDVTNLNRLHGAGQPDADAMRSKVLTVAESITKLGLGIRVVPIQTWVDKIRARNALKACDVVFGCTDDNVGRILLNRFAYFYATPVIDMGLAIEVGDDNPPQIKALDGRVTVLGPNHPCLLCWGVIDPVLAREESLRRDTPEEYERHKAEAYVIGEGDPNPSVVTFTTEVACMAIQEFVHRLQGFRGPDGAVSHRIRKFHLFKDVRPSIAQERRSCPLCVGCDNWGRGDVDPFLDQVV